MKKALKIIMHVWHCNEIPVFKGHVLNREDLVIRQHILNLMCSFETSWANPELAFPEIERGIAAIARNAGR